MKKVYFIFGYIRSYIGNDGGSTTLDFRDMLELEKAKPEDMIQTVSDEMKTLIIESKLSNHSTGGTCEDHYSTFDQFFGEFIFPKKNGTPEDKAFIENLNRLFLQEVGNIFEKRR